MQCTLIGLIDSMFTSLSYIFSLLLFHWLSIVYCLTSPLWIGDNYALCFSSAHELHSVHTMFLLSILCHTPILTNTSNADRLLTYALALVFGWDHTLAFVTFCARIVFGGNCTYTLSIERVDTDAIRLSASEWQARD